MTQSMVWLVEMMDYRDSYVHCVGTTRENAIAALKSTFGPPYVVAWKEPHGLSQEKPYEFCEFWISGKFEAVAGTSTAHTQTYRVYPLPLFDGPAP